MLQASIQLYKNAYSGLSRPMWWLALVIFINRSGTMVIPFMTLYITQKLGYSIEQAGWVVALFGAGAVCGAWRVPARGDGDLSPAGGLRRRGE